MIRHNMKEDFQLLLTVINTEVTSINSEWTILFEIELISEITKKDWRVSKTIYNIKELYYILIKTHTNLPDLNFLFSINWTKISSNQDIDLLRIEIQNFLNTLIERAELINSSHVKTFLELENHQQDFFSFCPLLINQIHENMEITDFRFSQTNSLLFVGTAYSANSGTISSYFSSISSLWNNSFLGEISIYHLAKSNYEEIHLEKLFKKAFYSQVCKIAYLEGDNIDILSVGLNDGSLMLFRIYANINKQNSSLGNELVDNFSKIKPHKNPIIDFGIEADLGYIYTAAFNEKSISISEINYETVIKNIPVSNSTITCFKYDKENKRIILIDAANSIWIMQINIIPIQAFHGQNSQIRCMSIESDINFLFTGSDKGILSIYEYNDNDTKKKFSLSKKLEINTGMKITSIKFKQSKHELISSFTNGSVGLWTHYENYPEYILDCHEKKVTKVQYEESMKLLITSSTDKTLKLWHLPEYWPSETMRRDKETNEKFFLDDYLETTHSTHHNMSKLQDALKNLESENLFHEETSGKLLDDIRESMITIRNETSEEEEDKDNKITEKNDYIENSHNYSFNSLDGWDEDVDVIKNRARVNFDSTFKDLFSI